MTNRQADEETRLTDYLLGRLSPQEAASIEQQYLADPAFHDALRAAERDLIDRYVHGELRDPEEFETRYLVSPARRERVAFARALDQALTRAPGIEEAAHARSTAWRRALDRVLGAPLAVAAALVIAVAGWLLVASRPAPPQPTPAPAARSEPGRVAEKPPPDAALLPRATPEVEVRVATLVLTPTATRSSDRTPTLGIERATEVRLELYPESIDFDRYRAAIRSADGQEIWRQEQLAPVTTASGPAIIVTLPADRLRADDYTVRLSGVGRGQAEEVAGYSFRVTR